MNSQLSWRILNRLACINRMGFSFQDLVKEFPDNNPQHLRRVLSKMIEDGMIKRIMRNRYHIVPLQPDRDNYVPDPFQVAKYMMLERPYYIGYASAMMILGLTERSCREVYVVSPGQARRKHKSYMGMSYHFIQHASFRFIGFNSMWINRQEKAMVSDPEKTIVDISSKPMFGGGIVEVGKAILQANAWTDHDKLFYYFARNRQKLAKKRFLFLSELLDLEWTDDHERLRCILGSGVSLLDPEGPDQGKQTGRFGLKINVDPANLKKQILSLGH